VIAWLVPAWFVFWSCKHLAVQDYGFPVGLCPLWLWRAVGLPSLSKKISCEFHGWLGIFLQLNWLTENARHEIDGHDT